MSAAIISNNRSTQHALVPFEPHTGGTWYCRYGIDQMCGAGTTLAQLAPNSCTGELGSWWIFSDSDTHGQRAADALLMTSAKDMLEALRRAALVLKFIAKSSPAIQDDYEAMCVVIAKATGGAS